VCSQLNALRELPAEPFDMSQWSYARVNIDYHIAFDANFYSVPYTLVQERVEVRATPTTIEILHKGQRVASHVRGHGREQVFTQREHRPKSHQAHLEWTPSRMVHWAEQIGPHTAKLFERILAEKPHPEMGYRSCLGIIRLAEQYSSTRSGCRSGHTDRCLPLQEREIDPEELPRPTTTPRTTATSSRVVKKLEQLETAWLKILHKLPFRMIFFDPETAPTISLSRSYKPQGNPRCFGRACSPMSPEQ
jgi:hypothetical protein